MSTARIPSIYNYLIIQPVVQYSLNMRSSLLILGEEKQTWKSKYGPKGNGTNLILNFELIERIINISNTQMEPKLKYHPLDCSFLEVTINSNKLMGILEQIMKQVNENSLEIKIMRQVIPTVKESVTSRLEMTEGRIQLENEKIYRKIKEEIQACKLQVQAMETELNKNKISLERQSKQREQEMGILDENRKTLESVIKSYEQDRLSQQEKINYDISCLKESIRSYGEKLSHIDGKFEDQFQMIILKVRSILNSTQNYNQKSSTINEAKVSSNYNAPTIKESKSSDQKRISLNKTSNWAQFSAKISSLDKTVSKEHEASSYFDKVMYAKVTNLQEQQLPQNEATKQKFFFEKETVNQTQLDEMHEANKKCFQFLRNKCVILEEKIGINIRKRDKDSQCLAQMKSQLKKIEERRNEDQAIEVLSSQLKKINETLIDELEKKITKELFEREKQKLLEKMQIIQENMIDKAQKGDMKKAFLFMEEKIKQLILLIASDQNEEKDGALRRLPFKCLSCDKSFESATVSPSRVGFAQSSQTSREKQHSVRALTRNIKKRVHRQVEGSA